LGGGGAVLLGGGGDMYLMVVVVQMQPLDKLSIILTMPLCLENIVP
jgi:hypothetical protein